MNRYRGTFAVPANYEPLVSGPFDARSLVFSKAALIDPSTWQQPDGTMYIYSGMLVVVSGDSVSENNGLYILQDKANYTLAESWLKLADQSKITALEESLQAVINAPIALRRDNDYNYKPIENTLIPVKGEVCFVDVAGYGLRAKVGDGVSTFAQLPYADEATLKQMNNLIVKGYFYQSQFYADDAHTVLLEDVIGRIYIDTLTSKIYTYNGLEYTSQNNDIPRASAETPGIMKLYDETGSNTDGTMTQRAITDELDDKFEMEVNHDDEMLVFDRDLY